MTQSKFEETARNIMNAWENIPGPPHKRALYSMDLTQNTIAERYKIHSATVSRIVRNKWRVS